MPSDRPVSQPWMADELLRALVGQGLSEEEGARIARDARIEWLDALDGWFVTLHGYGQSFAVPVEPDDWRATVENLTFNVVTDEGKAVVPPVAMCR